MVCVSIYLKMRSNIIACLDLDKIMSWAERNPSCPSDPKVVVGQFSILFCRRRDANDAE